MRRWSLEGGSVNLVGRVERERERAGVFIVGLADGMRGNSGLDSIAVTLGALIFFRGKWRLFYRFIKPKEAHIHKTIIVKWIKQFSVFFRGLGVIWACTVLFSVI
jgi:hypothetical protein